MKTQHFRCQNSWPQKTWYAVVENGKLSKTKFSVTLKINDHHFVFLPPHFLNNNKTNLLKIIIYNEIRFRKIFCYYFLLPCPDICVWMEGFWQFWHDSVTLFTWSRAPVIDNYFIFSNHSGLIVWYLQLNMLLASHWSIALILASDWSLVIVIWIGIIGVINLSNNGDTNNGPWPYISPRHEPGHHLTLSHTGQTDQTDQGSATTTQPHTTQIWEILMSKALGKQILQVLSCQKSN